MEIIRSMLSPNDLRRILQNGAAIRVVAAIQAGIVDELVQAGGALGQALKVAREYAQIPPQSLCNGQISKPSAYY